MLPQIFDMAERGPRDRGPDAMFRAQQAFDDERRMDAQRQEAREEAERTQALRRGLDAPRVRRTEMYDLPQRLSYTETQADIPGLKAMIEESNRSLDQPIIDQKRATILKFLDDYPEMVPLLEQRSGTTKQPAKRISPSAFEQYRQFADLTQVYSDPLERAALLNDALDTGDSETGSTLRRAEELYTSGDPEQQQIGRSLMIDSGVDEAALQAIESPAFNPKRPLVGGGGYVDIFESDDAKYINERARRFQEIADDLIVNRDEATRAVADEFQSRFPGLATQRQKYPERTFYETGNPNFYDGMDEGDGYRVDVNRGGARVRLTDLSDLSSDNMLSRNVLRFLRENPSLQQQSVSYRIGAPGESMTYNAIDELPEALKRPILRYVQEQSMIDRPAGTLLANSPLDNSDLIYKAYRDGLTEETSSYLRQLQPFEEAGVSGPNIRGKAYTQAGYGPVGDFSEQYTYIDAQGNAIPLQPTPPEKALTGRISVYGDGAAASPAVPASQQPRYYQTLVPGITPENMGAQLRRGVQQVVSDIKRTPASLVPGFVDLIPSREAIQRGAEEGPLGYVQQVGTDFVRGLPAGAVAAPVLANPALAPFAPGIAGGAVLTQGANAIDEAVKQKTGKSLLTRVQETAGKVSGDTRIVGTPQQPGGQNDSPRAQLKRELDRIKNNTVQITPGPAQTPPKKAPSGENEFQRRLRLAGEARKRDPFDFGITEILFGR